MVRHNLQLLCGKCMIKSPMQIAGNTCKVCKRGIILSSEGKFCAACEVFVHLTCECKEICDACGRPFQHYELPKADPLSEAILPRALRPARSGGPLATALLLLLPALILIIIYYAILGALANGH
jgi:hypothetical protein